MSRLRTASLLAARLPFGFGAGAFIGVARPDSGVDDANTVNRHGRDIQPDEEGPLSSIRSPTPDTRPRTKAATDAPRSREWLRGLGLLAKGESAEVVGRDNDSLWLAIRPPIAGRG
jgi:hypothetical protein